MIHSVPLTAPNPEAVNSLRELRAMRRNAAQIEQEAVLRTSALDIVEGCRAWVDRARSMNDSSADHARHDPTLTVLDHARTVVANGQTSWYGKLTAEVRCRPNTGEVEKANLKIEDTVIKYHRAGETETWQQLEGGVHTKVVIDHQNQLLTWEY